MKLDRSLPVEVASPAEGTYRVSQYGASQHDTAVYIYSWGWRCEDHGTQLLAHNACDHAKACLQFAAERRGDMSEEVTRSFRHRAKVAFTSKGLPSIEVTVEGTGFTKQELTDEIEAFVAILREKFPTQEAS